MAEPRCSSWGNATQRVSPFSQAQTCPGSEGEGCKSTFLLTAGERDKPTSAAARWATISAPIWVATQDSKCTCKGSKVSCKHGIAQRGLPCGYASQQGGFHWLHSSSLPSIIQDKKIRNIPGKCIITTDKTKLNSHCSQIPKSCVQNGELPKAAVRSIQILCSHAT